ncbi:MAG: helix-turn-helix domain-containing protein [Sphaerochaetaceae bacterium]
MSILSSVHTGKLIKNYLDEYNITQKDLSARTGISEKHISHLLNGDSRLTEDVALKLEKVLTNVPASYWLNYEAKYREALAREMAEMKPFDTEELNSLARRFHFKEVFKGLDWDLQKQANRMLSLLQISDFNHFEKVYSQLAVSFMEDGGELEPIAIWLSLCREEVENQNKLNDTMFNSKDLKKALFELKAIAENVDAEFSLVNARKWLNEKGVCLVIQDAITNSKIRGAVTLYKTMPTIYLSLRFKTHDHAWFALIHEIGHLLLHFNGKDSIISLEDGGLHSNEREAEANQFARDFFIDETDYQIFLKTALFSKISILNFARSQGIHPGIVVARLQHDSYIGFSDFNMLKSRIA